ncbi:MAG: VOC family protein [Pseudomonadales bacterium]
MTDAMTAGCPDFWLDHVALVSPDLDQAYDVYTRMGFNLSPRSSHQGQLELDGPVELYGAGNHCAMFSTGYLEILGITDPERYCEHVRVLLNHYSGLHLIALGCADIERQAAALRENLGSESTSYAVSRDVPLVGGGSKEAIFKILQLPEETFPEADLFFIEHENADVLWQPELLAQPNGVVGLSRVIVCSDQWVDATERLTAALAVMPFA